MSILVDPQKEAFAQARFAGKTLVESRGDVLVNGKPATKGSPVAPGDVVETGKGARAVYLIDDNVFLQRQNSRVEFGNSVETFLRIVTGGLLSVFGKGGSRKITTPTAAIGIRGTGCYIETDEKKTYFCLCFGSVDLQPVNGQPSTFETTHHEKPLWIEDGKTRSARVVNHTDAEVIMLEALAGRPSPFPAGSGGRY